MDSGVNPLPPQESGVTRPGGTVTNTEDVIPRCESVPVASGGSASDGCTSDSKRKYYSCLLHRWPWTLYWTPESEL